MGCGQSLVEEHRHSRHSLPVNILPAEVKEAIARTKRTNTVQTLQSEQSSVLQIGDRFEMEVEAPEAHQHFNSWNHQVDEIDRRAMRRGHAMPMNQAAHFHFMSKLEKSLSTLAKNPEQLKQEVRQRRKREEIAKMQSFGSLPGANTEAGSDS
ncbi:unnamed protein product [Effrenium voratum]|uniref:Uncharacterized protein n=1 Tax=Effrenium voratum TaxID=2562239 RepID=A0AA36J016_9DINO|nr:unnamed protein product [Effrenium voratum]